MAATRARPWLIPFVLALVTFVAFAPALQNEFVDWDDVENFTRNPSYRGLGWAQLGWMWTTSHLAHYVPVTWMTLGLDYLVWGMNPAGYHLTSLLLHVANAVLFYLIVLRLLDAAAPADDSDDDTVIRRLAAGLAALLFAVHPLRVESVAWVTERRDVVSGLFYLLAVLAYLRDAEAPADQRLARRRWYWIALGCFLLATLSKSMAVTLPLVLMALDVYPLRRVGDAGWWSADARRRWAEKLPFIAVSIAVGAVAFSAVAQTRALASMAAFGVLDRLAISAYGVAFYLWKTLVPLELSPFYPLRVPVAPLSARYVVAGCVVVAMSVAAILVRRRWPLVAVAWLVYLVTLFPVSGAFQAGPQAVADHYSYLATMSWAAVAGAAVFAGGRRGRAFAGVSIGVLAVLALSVLTWTQVGVWRDSERLWTHAVAVTPSALAHYHLGDLELEQSRWPEAAEHYRVAASLPATRADLERIHLHWGLALARLGKFMDAVDHYREVVRLAPDNVNAHYNWGNVLFASGRTDEAIDKYRVAVQLKPDFAEAYNNWGRALAEQEQWTEAIVKYREALRLRPNYPRAAANLEDALARTSTPR